MPIAWVLRGQSAWFPAGSRRTLKGGEETGRSLLRRGADHPAGSSRIAWGLSSPRDGLYDAKVR